MSLFGISAKSNILCHGMALSYRRRIFIFSYVCESKPNVYNYKIKSGCTDRESSLGYMGPYIVTKCHKEKSDARISLSVTDSK